MSRMRGGAAMLLAVLTGCRAEEWNIDKQGVAPAGNFWGRVMNFDGNLVTLIDNYPLKLAGSTKISITTSPPVFEVRDVTVTAWIDASGTRQCTGDDCQPLDGDPVVTLRNQNWPFVYDIVFQAP